MVAYPSEKNLHPDNITENLKDVPYDFVADDAFPLTTEILKPFRKVCLNSAKEFKFNLTIPRKVYE